MKKMIVLGLVSLLVTVLCVSCSRPDTAVMVVQVPEMDSALDARIVTNAALNEVVGPYDGVFTGYDVDMKNHLVLYHENRSAVLLPAYQERLRTAMAEVGFGASVRFAGRNPYPQVIFPDGRIWTNRHTVVFFVPQMCTETDANIVVDAIAYARLGGDHAWVQTDRNKRKLTATYLTELLSTKNIEQAIACTGYRANHVPASRTGGRDLANGWSRVRVDL